MAKKICVDNTGYTLEKGEFGAPYITFTDEQLKHFKKISGYLSIGQIADYYGFSRSTFDRMRERDERVERAYNAGKARCIEKVASGLIQSAVEGNIAAAVFFLKTQARWRDSHENLEGNQVNILIDSVDSKL